VRPWKPVGELVERLLNALFVGQYGRRSRHVTLDGRDGREKPRIGFWLGYLLTLDGREPRLAGQARQPREERCW
jgi:hypothetical protein